jgi:hypothetical protein
VRQPEHHHRARTRTYRFRADTHADRDRESGHDDDPHRLYAGPDRDSGRADASAYRGPDQHPGTDRDSRRYGNTGNNDDTGNHGDSGRDHDTGLHGDAACRDADAPLHARSDDDASSLEHAPSDRVTDAASSDADALTPGEPTTD